MDGWGVKREKLEHMGKELTRYRVQTSPVLWKPLPLK